MPFHENMDEKTRTNSIPPTGVKFVNLECDGAKSDYKKNRIIVIIIIIIITKHS